MKYLPYIVLLCFVSACSKSGNDSQTSTCTDAVKRCMPPVTKPTLKLKTKDGEMSVNLEQIIFAKVNLDAPSLGSETTIEKQFNDEFAIYLVRQLGLFTPIGKPRVDGSQPGNVSAGPVENLKITGEILIYWQETETLKIHTKYLFVLSGEYLQDFEFPETYYKPSQNLNEDWLMQQKTEHAAKP